jgi:transposase
MNSNLTIAEERMKTVEEREKIRRAYYLEEKSYRQIAQELGISRNTVRSALDGAVGNYTLRKPRPSIVLGPYKGRIGELLMENDRLPRKQRYTSHRIYHQICSEGYQGAESTVRHYIGIWRREHEAKEKYLPLEFDAGTDAQVDWGEGIVILGDESVTAQLFMMRLCYSDRLFVMAFPFQKQEAFLEGHVQAFHHFGGVPRRLTYDNLTTAVRRILEGRNRQEQETFIGFRSHYLFESNFCTPRMPHQKGKIENGVGFGRRNFLVPLPVVSSYEELNAHLLAACLEDDQRYVDGQTRTIHENWETEKPHMLPLPEWDYACCVTRSARVNPYSQVEFETNRYSVPVDTTHRDLVLKAYPFRVDILHQDQVIASHGRSTGREQDVIEPMHYLPLLEQRPGAFEHAKPMRRWREQLPPIYEKLLAVLRTQGEAMGKRNYGIREFLRVLKLHGEYPAHRVEEAVSLAMEYGCVHADGVQLCLHQLLNPENVMPSLDLAAHPDLGQRLTGVGNQAIDLSCYEQLLTLDAEGRASND